MDNNAESLHTVGKDKTSKTGPGFVNPGTPASPLVSLGDMKTQGTVASGTAKLKSVMSSMSDTSKP